MHNKYTKYILSIIIQYSKYVLSMLSMYSVFTEYVLSVLSTYWVYWVCILVYWVCPRYHTFTMVVMILFLKIAVCVCLKIQISLAQDLKHWMKFVDIFRNINENLSIRIIWNKIYIKSIYAKKYFIYTIYFVFFLSLNMNII